MRELESNRPGMKGDSSEMLQVLGSNEQNHRVALLSAAGPLGDLSNLESCVYTSP